MNKIIAQQIYFIFSQHLSVIESFIKSPKRSGETYCFVLFLRLAAQILSGQILHNHWMDCSKIKGYGRYGCKIVKKGFKMPDSKAGPQACLKPPIFFFRLFLIHHSKDCSDFLHDKY